MIDWFATKANIKHAPELQCETRAGGKLATDLDNEDLGANRDQYDHHEDGVLVQPVPHIDL